MARDIGAGSTSNDQGFVFRTLGRISDRRPFDDRDDGSWHQVHRILDADIRSEIVGTERRFVGTTSDDQILDGEMLDCPVYSERGERLLVLRKLLDDFLAARAATLDRAAAEKAIRRMTSG